jgi:DNA gyrase/topoisomerase IV subunit A
VDLRENYDATTREPVVLPVCFPNLLVNGTTGIAVGMATNIPPHNLGEVVRAAVHLIDDPEATTAQLLDRLKGPDFPLGGRVLADRATLRKIYEDGTGSIKVQGEWKLEDGKKRQIVVTSIPYGVDKGNLKEQIGIIIADRKLPQAVDLWDESNAKEGMRMVLDRARRCCSRSGWASRPCCGTSSTSAWQPCGGASSTTWNSCDGAFTSWKASRSSSMHSTRRSASFASRTARPTPPRS